MSFSFDKLGVIFKGVMLCALINMVISVSEAYGQCEGNQGENIFEEGDFGSGRNNVLTPDPMIAPGYNYQLAPPPNDGSYTITNNTTNWGLFAGSSWANIGDNSSDPNGYMMVVNASFSPGLFYEEDIDGLCENTEYVFSADVYNLTSNNAIRPNISFLLDGQSVYSTGAIPELGQWQTFGFTFATAPGQTSLTLSLRNNAPGGLGNDLALDNISFRACGPQAFILPEEVANICEDGSPIGLDATIVGDEYDSPFVQWQQSFDEGLTWQNITDANEVSYTHTALSSGYYYYRYLLANGSSNILNDKCRVVSNVKLVYVIPKLYFIVDTLCQGLAYTTNGIDYGNTGMYVDSLLTVLGCDSIVNLDLTIVPDPGIIAGFEIDVPSCRGNFDGAVELVSISQGAGPYSVQIDGDADPLGHLIEVPAGGYEYMLTDRHGCRLDTLVQVVDKDSFVIDLGPDVTVELGDSYVFFPYYSEEGESLQWSAVDPVVCQSVCEQVNMTPTEDQTVELTIYSVDGGCEAFDAFNITVEKSRKVYFPNIISWSSADINRYFTIFGSEPNVKDIQEVRIYDRWGSQVYYSNDLALNSSEGAWDGTYNGKKLNAGVYAYIVKVQFLDDEVIDYAGSLVLID